VFGTHSRVENALMNVIMETYIQSVATGVDRLFLYEERERLYTRRFPAYAPELNPDKQIWNVLKIQESSNRCPATAEGTETTVKDVMNRLKDIRGEYGMRCHIRNRANFNPFMLIAA
jgi:transposase